MLNRNLTAEEVNRLKTERDIPELLTILRDEADYHTAAKREGVAALLNAAAGAIEDLSRSLTASEKRAARWDHARKFLAIEDIEQWQSQDWRGHEPNELESLRADAAIDAAMEKANG